MFSLCRWFDHQCISFLCVYHFTSIWLPGKDVYQSINAYFITTFSSKLPKLGIRFSILSGMLLVGGAFTLLGLVLLVILYNYIYCQVVYNNSLYASHMHICMYKYYYLNK